MQLLLGKASSRLNIRYIVIVALLVRLVYGLGMYYLRGTDNFNDDWKYIWYARDISSFGYLSHDLNPYSVWLGPVWPTLLAASWWLTGENYWIIIILNALFSAALVYVIYRLAMLLFEKKFIAYFSAVWAVFYFPFITHTPTVLKENLVLLLFASAFCMMLEAVRVNKGTSLKLLAFALLFTLLIHTDERYFIYLPFILIALFVLTADKIQGLKNAIVFAMFLFLTMIPWLYRNFLYYGRPVLLTTRTATFTDPLLGYPSTEDSLKMPYNRKNLPYFEKLTENVRAGNPDTSDHINLFWSQMIQHSLERGIEVRTFSRARHYWEEFMELWRPARLQQGMVAYGYRYERPWPWYSNILYSLTYGVLLPFMLIGLSFMWKQDRRLFFIIGGVLLIHTLAHVFILLARNRYRYPLDALVIITSFYGIDCLLNRRGESVVRKRTEI